MPRGGLVAVAALLVALTFGVMPGGSAPARAADMPTFRVEMKDGAIAPTRLEVPAGVPFKIVVSNTGTTPAEFESTSLHKEVVLAAGSSLPMVFRRLERGEYGFFDDFHPQAKATLVAR